MLWNLYRYRLKRLVVNRTLIFWAAIFPIILGTFFGLCFSNISEKTEGMESMKIAVVDDGGNEDSKSVKSFFKTMEEQGYVDIVTEDKSVAEKKLIKNRIKGIIHISDKISLEINENGMYQTILKSVIESFVQGQDVIMDTVRRHPDKMNEAVKALYSETDYNKEKTIAKGNMDPFSNYYFALFAMTCLFGATFGMTNTMEIQANQTDVAIRRNVSPTRKMTAVFTDFLAAMTVQMVVFVVVFFYMNIVMGIEFGDNYSYIMLAGLVGNMTGISYGYFIGVLVKAGENIKNGIVSATVLFMCFMSGLMIGDMKKLVEANVPIINRINPAALISDAFYSICVVDGMSTYVRAIITLLILTVIFGTISVAMLRREKYADI